MTRREICIKANAARVKKFNDTFTERFWAKINKEGADGCWNWTGPANMSGYGQMKRANRAEMVHRISFEFAFGRPPDDLQVCHRCDNPRCVNPAHLFLGTAQDNVDDCVRKNRRKYRHGDNHHNAKLTDDQVRDIRKRATQETKEVYLQLAAEFGVHWGHIQNIVKRIRRPDVV